MKSGAPGKTQWSTVLLDPIERLNVRAVWKITCWENKGEHFMNIKHVLRVFGEVSENNLKLCLSWKFDRISFPREMYKIFKILVPCLRPVLSITSIKNCELSQYFSSFMKFPR